MSEELTADEKAIVQSYMLDALKAMAQIVENSTVVPTTIHVKPASVQGGYRVEVQFTRNQRELESFAAEHNMRIDTRPMTASKKKPPWARLIEARGMIYGQAVLAWWMGYPEENNGE
jgi:hypothetical protein